ncbi:MAG: C40 family peptidase [Rubellimicrobium sp.]|nr:C40 family peptidase [Rubellimicrobium sp.]
MDRRLTPANGRVADIALQGQVTAQRFTAGDPARILRPVEDLRPAPGAMRDRQLLWGEGVTVYEHHDGWAFVRAARDGYVGYVESAALGGPDPATHRVAVPATIMFEGENLKSRDIAHLSFGARITVLNECRHFWETAQGFIPKKHLRPLDRPLNDPVTVAQLFFGAPYLWGGNSIIGIDCSGLVQAAHLACDIACPGDSDLQEAALGRETYAPPRRGDIWFWKGHVGLVVDEDTLIHASGHHMAVVYEPLQSAELRIKGLGGGEVTARKRL